MYISFKINKTILVKSNKKSVVAEYVDAMIIS